MKFIHIADIHLGMIPDSNMHWGEERAKELWSSFQDIVRICNEEKADLLLIAGDLFHRQPLVRELKEVNYILSRLENTKAVIMAGNHDYIGARSNYQGFEWNEKVHFFDKDTIEIKEYNELGVEVYGLSYRTRDITEPLYEKVKPQKNDKLHILLAHGGDDRNIPINRKKLTELGYDYIALGHIHKPEFLNDRAAYSGSLEPLDRNETGARGYIIGEISKKPDGTTEVMVRFVPHSIRQYVRCSLKLDRMTTNGALHDLIKDMMKKHGAQNIYSFLIEGFRDEAIHFDKQAIKALGNILEVEDQSIPDYDFDALLRENSDNIIGMFIRKIKESSEQDEVARKALYYGIEALLNAKE
jgi:exonuclease SbcD